LGKQTVFFEWAESIPVLSVINGDLRMFNGFIRGVWGTAEGLFSTAVGLIGTQGVGMP